MKHEYSKLRLFMKKDFSKSHRNDGPFFKAGQEVRIGKISESNTRFMLIDADDDRHAWVDMEDYNDYVEDRLV